MYVIDGIAYAGEPTRDLKVVDVRVVNDLSMLVRFSTGEVRLFDAASLLANEVFASLEDQRVFADCAIDHGILTWQDGAVDLSPEALYDLSYRYETAA